MNWLILLLSLVITEPNGPVPASANVTVLENSTIYTAKNGQFVATEKQTPDYKLTGLLLGEATRGNKSYAIVRVFGDDDYEGKNSRITVLTECVVNLR